MKHKIGISDCKVSNVSDDVLVTYALGSCIGVSICDKANHVAGLLHFQLPASRREASGDKVNPLRYADSGMQAMLTQFQALGGDVKRSVIKIAGGASMLDALEAKPLASIGKRNYTAIRQYLWKKGLMINAEQCGGCEPRSMYCQVGTGEVRIGTESKSVAL